MVGWLLSNLTSKVAEGNFSLLHNEHFHSVPSHYIWHTGPFWRLRSGPNLFSSAPLLLWSVVLTRVVSSWPFCDHETDLPEFKVCLVAGNATSVQSSVRRDGRRDGCCQALREDGIPGPTGPTTVSSPSTHFRNQPEVIPPPKSSSNPNVPFRRAIITIPLPLLQSSAH